MAEGKQEAVMGSSDPEKVEGVGAAAEIVAKPAAAESAAAAQVEDVVVAKPQPAVEVLQESNRDHGAAPAGQKPFKPMVKVPPRGIFSSYRERYLSPTDSLVSPISRGLLAKNRKGLRMLMPLVPPKSLETTFHRMNNENRVAK